MSNTPEGKWLEALDESAYEPWKDDEPEQTEPDWA
jgi:hypothetical protein